ncbi:MAG: hypothetical protein OXD46_12115 [Chloroflexi bacterium]|nr:hypothetical protein [Chloroflexota bacterium]
MRKKQIVLRSLIVAILAVAGCTTSMFTWVALDTNDSAGEAEAFLLLLRERKTAEAYHDTTTAHFRALQTSQEFDKVMELLGLPLTYRLDVWRDRRLETNNRSRIRGTLIDLGGQDVKFTVDMVREQGDWQVNAFVDDDRSGVGPGAWFKQIPLRDDLNQLTGSTMKIFRESIETGDMSPFYNYMSDSFTIGITLERLQNAYQSYIDANHDLTGIELLAPTFQELPVFEDIGLGIDEEDFTTIEDVMILKGYYPLDPRPVPFKLSYVYEHPEWKLFQFQISEPTIAGLSPQDCILWLQTQENKDPAQCFDIELNRTQRGIITDSR